MTAFLHLRCKQIDELKWQASKYFDSYLWDGVEEARGEAIGEEGSRAEMQDPRGASMLNLKEKNIKCLCQPKKRETDLLIILCLFHFGSFISNYNLQEQLETNGAQHEYFSVDSRAWLSSFRFLHQLHDALPIGNQHDGLSRKCRLCSDLSLCLALCVP